MRARFLILAVLAWAVTGCAALKPDTDQQRALKVVAASKTVLEMFKASESQPMDEFRALLPRAQGVVILSGLLKGGFIVAAEGGNGVLLAKDRRCPAMMDV